MKQTCQTSGSFPHVNETEKGKECLKSIALQSWSSCPKVLVIVYDPILEADGNKKLTNYYNWNNPDTLTKEYIADIKESSHNQVEFQVAEWIEHDEWPPLSNGFRYTDKTFKEDWAKRHFQPENFDYVYMLKQNNVKDKVEEGKIDEVWLFGFPGMGCCESCMAGTGAIWCNGPVVTPFNCSRPFVIMGFNYERGVDCMLEDLGHRAESILDHVYGSWKHTDTHLWGLFTRYDKNNPGEAACGNVHFAPNSTGDYDWGNTRYVDSTCDDWLDNFPNLTGQKRKVNCAEWGKGDQRLHHIWWLSHLPHHDGTIGGKLINWWKYIIELRMAHR